MPLRFIADVGSNHNQSMSRIINLIAAAKDIGCDAVKFQYFDGRKLYAPEFPDRVRAAVENELPQHLIPDIAHVCREKKIEFHCTPFRTDDVFVLRPWVDAFKIASYSILNLKLIETAAGQGLPIGISTGGAIASEILHVIHTVRKTELTKYNLTFYHCIPAYPATLSAGMMTRITRWHKDFNFIIGYSDHTRQEIAILAAIAADATTIEFHLDLNDCAGAESIHGHCWTAYDAGQMIMAARNFDMIINGNEKVVDYCEMRKWRNDPKDEMRPLKQYREELSK